ncbi:putative protease [Arcanobacterium pluranimalium]|uniref:peptidase U32 family protein n=1 Tax=Arcanobacterium pluranimalium TaxID=108028 RepID=UPI00195B5D35|nr:U32 family peptidase [Arcanobacterium pluranimalium]MBM7824300.1 putative protease [Arcanobacterium pluranimalium]
MNFPPITRRQKPEVLAPAGNLDTLKTAIDYGADAVYCGGQAFGMRTAPKNLTLEDFDEGVKYAHERGARLFVTCNILPTSSEVADMNAYMAQLGEIGVDALIVSDIGVLMAARQVAPNTEIHISTQAGVTNFQAANALAQLGASRVVLARELDLAAIRDIRANVSPELEIEAFVHGSMCMAFSGRCLISQHTTGRDANHGDCAQSCRWKYHVVEEKRPGQFIPVEITDQGTFLFNSQDMNLLAHVDDVLDAGVTSLKIEGRAKGAYYVAAMANAYKCAVNEYMVQRGYEDSDGNVLKPFDSREVLEASLAARAERALETDSMGGTDSIGGADAVDDAGATLRPQGAVSLQSALPKVEFPQWLLEEPEKVTHREYCTGFYYPESPASENIVSGGYINTWRWLGNVVGYDATERRLRIYAKNKIAPGMEIEFLFPNHAPVVYVVPEQGLQDERGHAVAEINHPAHEFSIPCDDAIPAGSMIRARMR